MGRNALHAAAEAGAEGVAWWLGGWLGNPPRTMEVL